MTITKIPIDTRKLLRSAKLISVSPVVEYKDGVRTNNVIGYRYGVVLPDYSYDRVSVKILGEQQMEAADDAIAVRFEDAEARLYCIDGRWDVTISATAIAPAKTASAGKQ